MDWPCWMTCQAKNWQLELYPFLESKKWYLLFKGILWSHDLLVKTIN